MSSDSLAHLTQRLPAAAPLSAAASAITAHHAADLPDLSGLIVLLPNLHAVMPFARALAAAAGKPTLLLPTLTTLPQLAASHSLPHPLIANSARQSMVYAALRERRWFREPELWAISGELLQLFDEITLNHVELPQQETDFVARLAAAYQARAGESLQFEARLVHELWYALQRTLSERIDHASAYQRRLSRLAAHPERPLYAIGMTGLARSEVEFFARYAEQQPVTLFQLDPLADATEPIARVLAASWRATDASLPERATQLCAAHPTSPLAAKLRLFPAPSLEQQARAADSQVRQWLLAGKRNIAVVAQDRLAARRVRALLERAQVLVEDETGWTLSTTAASSVIMRWCDLISGDFFHQDLLDFLKSPLVFADWPYPERKEAVYELEGLIRDKNLVSRLIHYRAAAHETESGCRELLERLHQAQRLWPRKTQSLGAWLDTLQLTLDALGITPALAADLAGVQLLATLAQLREELHEENTKFQFNEWRRWLDQQLETATFRDTGIESPVVFTHLPATRLRPFDGIVLLGCDAAHLPARASDGLFFNQSVRSQLGLPTRETALQIEQCDLASLITSGAELLVTWQHMVNGEEHLLSPYFELLQTVHKLAWGDALLDHALAAQAASVVPPVQPAPRVACLQPQPTLGTARIPATISASGYNSLMTCPYQYYARHGLKLNELDDVQVEMEKRDFGELVHRILLAFHQDMPTLTGKPIDEPARRLREISADIFGPMLKLNYLSHAWALRWDKLVPGYIDWQLEREHEGWRWHAGEVSRQVSLPLTDDTLLTLRGTLDRIDRHGTDYTVLDYKTRTPTVLRTQLKAAGEDVQLPVYVLLAAEEVSAAGYLSLDRDEVKIVPLEDNLSQLAQAVGERLTDIFSALHAGAGLPAQGVDAACNWCEMRGLCRRDYWEGEI